MCMAEEQGSDGRVVALDDLVEVVRMIVKVVRIPRWDVGDEPDALGSRFSRLKLINEPFELVVRIMLHGLGVGEEIVFVVEDAVV